MAGSSAQAQLKLFVTAWQCKRRIIKLFLSYDLLDNLTLGNRPQGNNLKGKKNPHKDSSPQSSLEEEEAWHPLNASNFGETATKLQHIDAGGALRAIKLTGLRAQSIPGDVYRRYSHQECRVDRCLLLCKNILTGMGREFRMNGSCLIVIGLPFLFL